MEKKLQYYTIQSYLMLHDRRSEHDYFFILLATEILRSPSNYQEKMDLQSSSKSVRFLAEQSEHFLIMGVSISMPFTIPKDRNLYPITMPNTIAISIHLEKLVSICQYVLRISSPVILDGPPTCRLGNTSP